MRPPIRLAHFMFVTGLILVMGPEEYPPVTGPLWPVIGFKVLGLILFLGGMGIMQNTKRARR